MLNNILSTEIKCIVLEPYYGPDRRKLHKQQNHEIEKKASAQPELSSRSDFIICWNSFGPIWTTPCMATCLYSFLCLSGAGSCTWECKKLIMCTCVHCVKTKTTIVTSYILSKPKSKAKPWPKSKAKPETEFTACAKIVISFLSSLSVDQRHPPRELIPNSNFA